MICYADNLVNRILPLIFILLWIGTTASAHEDSDNQNYNECASIVKTGPEVDEIRRLEEQGAATNEQGDNIESAKRFFAEEFITVRPQGDTRDLGTILNNYRNGVYNPWARRFELGDTDITVYCDAATVIGHAEAWTADMKDDSGPIRFVFLHIWIKREGTWRYTAQQYTRLNPPRSK